MQEMGFRLHRPLLMWRILERLGLRDVSPEDICPLTEIERLYQTYPDLRGDTTAIGPGDDGDCQTWRNNPGWWMGFFSKL